MGLVIINSKVHGKYLVSLIVRVVILGGPFWLLQVTYSTFACTYSTHLPGDSKGFYF